MDKGQRAIVAMLGVVAVLLVVNVAVIGSRRAEAQSAMGGGEPYLVKTLLIHSRSWVTVWSDGQVDWWFRENTSCEISGHAVSGPVDHPFPVVDAALADLSSIVMLTYEDGRVDIVSWDPHSRCTVVGEGGASYCMGDVDRDGVTDFDDLLFVLTDWGPCEG